MEVFNNKGECCGCGLCTTVCKKNAIVMKEDSKGFIYPEINEELCIQCGMCTKICSYNSEEIFNTPIESYAALTKNKRVLSKSASGGVFATIAEQFIKSGGWVCGSVMEFKKGIATCYHRVTNKLNDIEKMQGSKYVQSDITDALPEIKQLISKKEKILFCGTPCQVSAVKKMAADYDELYTIDIICHGVPSVHLYNEFLKCKSSKNREICDFLFRDKSKGKGFKAKLVEEINGKKTEKIYPAHLLSYYHYFLKSLIYRENCYVCKYAKEARCSDMTIGDYWGIQKIFEGKIKMDFDQSWSCVMINDQKGKILLKNTQSAFELVRNQLNDIKQGNAQLSRPSQRTEERERILNLFENKGYKAVEKDFKRKLGLKYYGLLLRNYIYGR